MGGSLPTLQNQRREVFCLVVTDLIAVESTTYQFIQTVMLQIGNRFPFRIHTPHECLSIGFIFHFLFQFQADSPEYMAV